MTEISRKSTQLPRVAHVRFLSLAAWSLAACLLGTAAIAEAQSDANDHVRALQAAAIEQDQSPVGHWGSDPQKYTQWASHSNRLIPVYTFGTKNAGPGIDLRSYTGENSPYRSEEAIRRIYGYLPEKTVNPKADYLDQTNIYDIQAAAFEGGKKKHIFLVVFDGMDWQTTRAAAIYNEGRVSYSEGRGTGTHFQEYMANGTSQFGYMVTSPHNNGTNVDVDEQRVLNPGGTVRGGYDPERGGPNPWTPGNDPRYPVGEPGTTGMRHAYTDSSCSASSMTTGIKSYNKSINVDPAGARVSTIAHQMQAAGYGVGAVTSVPISHATPAATYAHNVHRDDYQDLTRDLLGLRSISHPDEPLSGLDVLIGGGWGATRDKAPTQGKNFVPGNLFLTDADLKAVDIREGGRYVVAIREAGVKGAEGLAKAADKAAQSGQRLFGFYGVGAYNGHLPFTTANRDYAPVAGRRGAEKYTEADLHENPTLADMTREAIKVLERQPKGFWLLVESGDVDWANHDNNIDNSIGAVNSGDAAIKVITDWVEKHSNWEESLMIVTADHGHYLVLTQPELLAGKPATKSTDSAE